MFTTVSWCGEERGELTAEGLVRRARVHLADVVPEDGGERLREQGVRAHELAAPAHAHHGDALEGAVGPKARLALLERAGRVGVAHAHALKADLRERADHGLEKGGVDHAVVDDLAFAAQDERAVAARGVDAGACKAEVARAAKGAARRHHYVRAGIRRRAHRAVDGVVHLVKRVEQRTVQVGGEELDHARNPRIRDVPSEWTYESVADCRGLRSSW